MSCKHGLFERDVVYMPFSPRWVISSLVVTMLILIGGGVWLYLTQERALRHETEETLQAIANLQVDRIVQWRRKLIEEATELSESPHLTEGIERWLMDPDKKLDSLIVGFLQILQRQDHYLDVKILDSSGEVCLNLSENAGRLDETAASIVKIALREHSPMLTDLHLMPDGTKPHLCAAAPLFSGKGESAKPLGAILLQIDAREFLYPVLESWPLSSHSAESYLVRRDGDYVIFLTELRHQSNTALKLRIPLSQTNVTAVKAALDVRGVVVGVDYRGEKVLSALKAVPGSSWYLLAEIDFSEAFAVWKSESHLILGALLGIMVAMISLGGLAWLQTQKKHYMTLFNTEREIRENEAHYRILFHEATEGLAIADADTGELLDFNQAFLQLTGYEREDLLGKPQRMLHPEEPTSAGVTVAFEHHRSTTKGQEERSEIITKNGTIKQVEIKGNLLNLNGRRVVQGFFRDVTAEVRYHLEREKSLKLLHLLNIPNNLKELISNLSDLLLEWTGCDSVEFRLREGEDFPYSETRGFPPGFEDAENYLCYHEGNGDIRHGTNGNTLIECICGSILSGRSSPLQPFFTPRGSFWTNSTSELLSGSTGTELKFMIQNSCVRAGYESIALIPLRYGQDTLGLLQLYSHAKGRFTPELLAFLESAADQIAIAFSQRLVQQSLCENEHKFRTVADWTYDWEMWIGPQDQVIYTSPSMERITGYCPDELYSDPSLLQRIIIPEDQARWHEHVESWRSGSRDISEIEFRIINRSGEIRWIQHLCRPVSGPAGQPLGQRVTNRDITEHHHLQEEREALRNQLLQAHKMEAVGRLAGGVAHDFNNMLQSILGYANLALSEDVLPDTVREYLLEIEKAGLRSADLTRQLLAFARKQTVSPKVLDLNDTVAGMLKMLQRLIGEDIELVWSPGYELWRVRIDPSQIDQILANLAVNARDAIGGVGMVTIETSNTMIDDAYCENYPEFIPGEYVQLAVSDNGRGMDRETISRIFEPFFTTKKLGEGTGLGLATVYGIIKQNDGYINVYSEPGSGTTFRVYLPRDVTEITETPVKNSVNAIQGGTETILLVEDEESVLNLGKRILENLGYIVLAARTPAQAIRYTEEHSGEIHLVLTDVVMPEMNGRELVQHLIRAKPGLKSLFMSGYTADVIAHRGVLDEGVLFVPKPFTVEILATRVRAALEQ